MYSFYGGKQGTSFRIVACYDSIYDMVTAFQQGGNCSDVNYDEYVIIDTILRNNEKSNPENGILYRRGYNYSEAFSSLADDTTKTLSKDDANWENFVTHPGGGAIYVGQVVGPQGDTPAIEIQSWSSLQEYITNHDASEISGSYVVQPMPGYDENGTAADGYDSNHFKDGIRYGYCLIKDENNLVTGAYLAFDIPYTVFKIDATAASPYSNPTITEASDSLNHPFYKHYNLTIPQGIHGSDTSLGFEIDSTTNEPYLIYTTTDYTTSPATITSTRQLLPIAYIEKMAIDGDLILLKIKNFSATDYGNLPTRVYNNETYLNLGSVVKGNHIYANFETLTALQAAYPFGFGKDINGNVDVATAERAGWIATVGNDISGRTLYAYDYIENEWVEFQDVDIKPSYSILVSKPEHRNLLEADRVLNFEITSQPEDYIGEIGTSVIFTVETIGKNLTYQWQYALTGPVNAWKNVTNGNTNSYSVLFTSSRVGQKYRCIISDGTQSLVSQVVRLWTPEDNSETGLSFTKNDDGSIIVNGTALIDTTYSINNYRLLEEGQYILTGCPSGGSAETYGLRASRSLGTGSTYYTNATNASTTFSITEEGQSLDVYIFVREGITLNNKKFYPMLRVSTDANSDYSSYTGATPESEKAQLLLKDGCWFVISE